MPDDAVEVDFTQATKDMQKWSLTVGPTVDKETRHFVEGLASTVRGRVPWLTGTLAHSVEVIDVPGEVGWAIGEGEGAASPYARYIEFGGRHGRELVPMGRYLYPTVTQAEPQFHRAVEDAVTVSIERFNWSKPA